jgi:3-oxoacyl-[acyl-carrier-protein] synthase III
VRIETVQHSVPSRRIDTQWIVDKLRRRNASRFSDADLVRMEDRVRAFLEAAGSDLKYQIDSEGDERAIDLIADCSRRAVAVAGLAPGDVELILYTGVGRGWLEPSTASVVQDVAGLVRATGYDVLDGCAGWVRALELAHAYFAAGRYRNALIVNAELGFEGFGRWDFDTLEDLETYLATYTIGEAATATVLTDAPAASPAEEFHFRFANYGEHADLCMIPLDNVAQFAPAAARARLARQEPGRFYAVSKELLANTMRRLIETFRADPEFCGRDYDIGFGHAASEKASAIVCRGLGFAPERYYPTHARYGNSVAASIPLGLSLALEEGRLTRGQRVLVVAGASGISIGFARFVF